VVSSIGRVGHGRKRRKNGANFTLRPWHES
jgi:hypothetical protein